LRDFYAYDVHFMGGVRVAAADVSGRGGDDIITGTGPGSAPEIRVFDGLPPVMLRDFYAFDVSYTGGVYVGGGQVQPHSLADIFTGTGPGASQVRVFDGTSTNRLRDFYPLGASFTGGARVGAADATGNGLANLVVGPGPGSGGPLVRAFDVLSLAQVDSFFAYDPSFAGGVFVGNN
jgi:hypothetical protein